MQPIDLSFLEFPGVRIKGEFYDSLDPDVLVQDILEIELPNGEIIDLGWYPEHDTCGSYRVSVFDYSTMIHSQRYILDNGRDALNLIYYLILRHSTKTSSISDGEELELVYA